MSSRFKLESIDLNTFAVESLPPVTPDGRDLALDGCPVRGDTTETYLVSSLHRGHSETEPDSLNRAQYCTPVQWRNALYTTLYRFTLSFGI